MATGRNDPCPCGSGKKFKKCCGAPVTPAAETEAETAEINLNRAIAYAGRIGRLRERFCLAYLDYKHQALQEVGEELRVKVAANKENIACTNGCAACCYLYVRASIQECEAIVYYLYMHPPALERFLGRYKDWWEQVRLVMPAFKTIVALSNQAQGTRPGEMDLQYQGSLRDYRLQNIACPFLMDGGCTIYEIRPWVCAGVVASTPRDWCEPTSFHYSDVKFYTTEAYVSREHSLYLPTQVGLALGCFPVMVYQLLKKGYGMLELIPGLAGLETRHNSDPEVIAASSSFRANVRTS